MCVRLDSFAAGYMAPYMAPVHPHLQIFSDFKMSAALLRTILVTFHLTLLSEMKTTVLRPGKQENRATQGL